MSYTPPFSTFATVSVRRLAWALHIPMTSTVDRVMRRLPDLFDVEEVCRECRDTSKCRDCAFGIAHGLRIMQDNYAEYVQANLN